MLCSNGFLIQLRTRSSVRLERVSASVVNGCYFTVQKGGGVEARRLVRASIEPEADRILWFHLGVLRLFLGYQINGQRAGGISGV
jgi:hypothetical protein